MKELLFLCHRFPYPPNKGDKIRSYHWLEALADHYHVHLGAFVDDPADWAHRHALDALTASRCYRPLRPLPAKLRSLSGLLNGRSLSMGYYRDRGMARWVRETLETRPIAAILVFSSTMAPYVEHRTGYPRVLDFVDVDSDKWRQYAAHRSGLARRIFAREARCLQAEERRLAAEFDASVFVSQAEADFFRDIAPETADRVCAVGNGVDSVFFDPALSYADPFAGTAATRVVFTGAMDYGANVDAVRWFVAQVWPRIRQHRPDAQFWIVGARPQRAVTALAATPGVHVTGTVDDIRPYLAHADVTVAPMRVARGIQNKVLEALAMGRPIVMSEQAAVGLDPVPEAAACVTSDAQAYAEAVLRLSQSSAERTPCPAARAYVLRQYGWARQVGRLQALLDAPLSANRHSPAVPQAGIAGRSA